MLFEAFILLTCVVIYVFKKLNFHSIPVGSPRISYLSKLENFPESKVILNFWTVENWQNSHTILGKIL